MINPHSNLLTRSLPCWTSFPALTVTRPDWIPAHLKTITLEEPSSTPTSNNRESIEPESLPLIDTPDTMIHEMVYVYSLAISFNCRVFLQQFRSSTWHSPWEVTGMNGCGFTVI